MKQNHSKRQIYSHMFIYISLVNYCGKPTLKFHWEQLFRLYSEIYFLNEEKQDTKQETEQH